MPPPEYIPRSILVTGGAGMIGSNLVRGLIENEKMDPKDIHIVDNLWRGSIENIGRYIDIETNFFKRDLSKPNQMDEIILENNIDTVIHLADIVCGIGYVTQNERFVYNQNVLINSNTINSVYGCKKQIKAFVNIGTACSFPKTLQLSKDSMLTEEQMYPANPETSYGWSKLMGIYETALLQKETDILCCNLILHNVYGTPCDWGARSQVIPSLIQKAISLSDGEDFEVWGSGKQSRAFLHVSDAVNAIISAMKRGHNVGPIQVGPNFSTTIQEIAEIIVEKSGKKLKIFYNVSKPEGDVGRCADYTKAREILGWSPQVDIQTGIGKMVDEITKNMF